MKQQNQKAVTVRFPMSDYLEMVSEAETKNTTTADVIRQVWAGHQKQKSLAALLTQLELRLLRRTFDICAATVGLSVDERGQAARQVNQSLGKELVK